MPNRSPDLGSLRNSLARVDQVEIVNKRFSHNLRLLPNRRRVVVRDFDGYFTWNKSEFADADDFVEGDVFWDLEEFDSIPVVSEFVFGDGGVIVDTLTTNEFFEEVQL